MSEKNVKKLSQKLGLPIKRIWTRGNTGHRKDLALEDGRHFHYWPDGTLVEDHFPMRITKKPNATHS